MVALTANSPRCTEYGGDDTGSLAASQCCEAVQVGHRGPFCPGVQPGSHASPANPAFILSPFHFVDARNDSVSSPASNAAEAK